MSSDLTDYSAVIRAQIERDVARLKRALETKREGRVGDASAQYVELGYLVNSHQGQRIYGEGDLICGVPVSLSGINGRSIRVCADNVRMVKEHTQWDDELNRFRTEEHSYYEDLYKETTW